VNLFDQWGTLTPDDDGANHRLARQRCQSLGAGDKGHLTAMLCGSRQVCRHHHADRASRPDHVPSFNARSTAVTVIASAPRPTRTLMPSISTSIIPAPRSTWQRGILRWRRTDGEDGATSRTAGTNCSSSACESAAWDPCNCRRQPNNCCGQSVPSGYGRDGFAAHCYLSDNPRLVLVGSRPPATCTGEHLKPMNRLSDGIIHCVHSKPNGNDNHQTRRSGHH
jgi:hypothetical protein